MEKMQVTTIAYEAIEKMVSKSGNSGQVYLPKGWVNKRVKILLLEPVNKNHSKKSSKIKE